MIKIYSKKNCPFCIKAKNLLNELNVKFEEIDITEKPEIIEELAQKSGIRTVPQVFAGSRFIGSWKTVESLHEAGTLIDLCKE
jgi:glutaredoxin 3